MTSAGSTRIFPTYGAVSAAKAALESHIRQLAVELAPLEITINAIRAGVTDTPALRKIPGHEKMAEIAATRNPMGRMTTPSDVAAAIAVLCQPGTHWLTGTVIGVDGGEDIVGGRRSQVGCCMSLSCLDSSFWAAFYAMRYSPQCHAPSPPSTRPRAWYIITSQRRIAVSAARPGCSPSSSPT